MDASALDQIEALLEAILSSMLAEDPMSIVLKVKAKQSAANPATTTIRFPGKTPREAWRFSQPSKSLPGCE